MKDHYKVLGLLVEADEVVIKAAFKALAQKYHPDKHPGEKAEYNKIMSELNEAYSVLGFKHKRKEYDLKWSKFSQKGKPAKSKNDHPTGSSSNNTHPSQHSEHSQNSAEQAHEPHSSKHHSKKDEVENEFEAILKKLHNNQMDEYQLINLFEKTFSLKIEISSGYINNYSYTKDNKQHIVNFEKIKLELINHLTK